MDATRQYIAIDLKSFYASVECVARGLDPLDACLVVADASRTDKTICLAVSPALKAYGVPGRPRLFEVVRILREVNRGRSSSHKSTSAAVLAQNPQLAVDYIIAPPRMALYVATSKRILSIYSQFVSAEDIHVYSIDEVFIDVTSYLSAYNTDARSLAMMMIREVLRQTGITATAGIGTNMYLAKVAMDIVAKRMPADSDGVRIASLDEYSYRRQLWNHKPLTDFWRIGRGTARRLASHGILTMGQIARLSLSHEDAFFRIFGVNAELLIDHAWGWEPATIDLVKAYRPENHSLSSGQVLTRPYDAASARVVALEMADSLSLDLLDEYLVADTLTLTIGYDVESLKDPARKAMYDGPLTKDHYGRIVPAHSHGTIRLGGFTSSADRIQAAVGELFDRIVTRGMLIRRLNVALAHVISESEVPARPQAVQLDLFDDYDEQCRRMREASENEARERRRSQAILAIKKHYGRNAILRGLNYAEGATQRQRNRQIGGHNA